jgi:protoheme IX farnesyltransferase
VLLYTILTVAVTLAPAVTGTFGAVYAASAGLLGAVFLVLSLRLWRAPSRERAAVAFHFSLLYLALLFAGVAISAAV